MTDDRTNRRRFLTAAGVGTISALAGCNTSKDQTTENGASNTGSKTEKNDAPTAATSGGMLQLASDRMQTVDPINGKGGGSSNQWMQTFEGLMQFQNGKLPVKKQLAKDYHISNDNKTYTFDLKQGVKFHNGKELTAHDFVYSWNRLAESPNSRNTDDILGGTFTVAHDTKTVTQDGEETEEYKPGSLQVKAVDKYTFQFTLTKPFHGALSQIAGAAFTVVPEGIVGDIQGYDGRMNYQQFSSGGAVGTGPFQIDHWSKGNEFVVKKFDDYHGDVPNIDGIKWTILGSDSSSYNRAMNGNLDLFTLPTAKFQGSKRTLTDTKGAVRTGTYGPVRNGKTVNYGETTALTTEYLLFNTQRVKERAVRHAIGYIINQDALVRDVFKGLGTPAYHITPRPVYPGGPDAYDKHAKNGYHSQTSWGADGYPWGYAKSDIPAARDVMEKAGYSDSNEYSLTLTVFEGDSAWQSVAKLLRDKAGAAYIDLSVETAPFGTIISRAIDGSMDVFSLSDGLEWPEADNFLRFLHPSTSSSFTRWGQWDGGSTKYTERSEDFWQNYLDNRAPTDSAQKARNRDYIGIEECNWYGVAELPIRHGLDQRFWYDDVDVQMYGPMTNQQFNHVKINR